MRMDASRVAALLALGILLAPAALARAGGDSDDVTFASLLREMTDRSVVTCWPAHPYR